MQETNFYVTPTLDRVGRPPRRSLARPSAGRSGKPAAAGLARAEPDRRGRGRRRAALLSRDRRRCAAGRGARDRLAGAGRRAARYFAARPFPSRGAAGICPGRASPICAASARCSPASEGGLLAYARGLMHWHQRHRFCGVCGSPTRKPRGRAYAPLHQPGLRRRASPAHRSRPSSCGSSIRAASCWAARSTGRRACIRCWRASSSRARASRTRSRREVAEEVALRSTEVNYHSSQPWPFPASIMLGFTAIAAGRPVQGR